jgi:ABC-2 type transport system ATP-binding protein
MPDDSRPAIVQLEGLGKRYGEFVAVHDLCLEIFRGEVFGLLGPNGAGKTTTMKMLIGVLCASQGTARIGGHDCFTERPEVMRHVGYLPDEPVFYDYLRGRELISFVAEMHGLPAARARNRVDSLVQRLELSDAITDYAVNYSRGMKKKLGLILALLHDPDVLILDEPTNGLDPHATRQIHEILRELSARGTTVMLSTHLLEQAQRLCNRIAILHKGRLTVCGTLDELASGGRSLEDRFFEATEGTVGGSESST